MLTEYKTAEYPPLTVVAEEIKAPEELLLDSYIKYRKLKGVICWSHMRDSALLSATEMDAKYPRDRYQVASGETLAKEALNLLKRYYGDRLWMTAEQLDLYANLRKIPTTCRIVVYDVGPNDPENHSNVTQMKNMHPSELGIIGLVGETFKFTQDQNRAELLRRLL